MFLPYRPLLERVPLTRLASFTIREFKRASFKNPWHQHPEMELTWILKGSGVSYVGDSVEPFHAVDFCLLGANLPHTWISREGTKNVCSLVVQCDPSRWGGLLHLPEFARLADLFVRSARGLRFDGATAVRLRKKIFRQGSSPDPAPMVAEQADGVRPPAAHGAGLSCRKCRRVGFACRCRAPGPPKPIGFQPVFQEGHW